MKTIVKQSKQAAPSTKQAAQVVKQAAPPVKQAARKRLSIQTMTLEQFAVYGAFMAGGFCHYDAKRNKAGIITSARLDIPRFKGESFAAFVGHFTASLPEGARLEKPTLDVLRGIFTAADDAAAVFGAEAARISFHYGRNGLKIQATSVR